MSETEKDFVNIKVDGKEIRVPKGMNLIQAAKLAGVEIPHYCYHPDLSIAGNCRMCQVEIEGAPKLGIACNSFATEGLSIKTHFSSPQVLESQRATLEFLLINHPLDCTVCDQAGHCKLQDYYYEYNSKASRFTEDKVHKVKALPLGPEVVYDGERCIMCTRCVRFCDEVTETSELGAFNRGDRGVIGVVGGKELDNPLSGTVVDLCPVGALTHRRWRFNSRIWYSGMVDSICTGCSTGCNVKVAVRDDRVVQVKARYNEAVNKEWLCDEGRYGFESFQPRSRLTSPLKRSSETFLEQKLDELKTELSQLQGSSPEDAAVFLSPRLTLEEMWVAQRFAQELMGVSIESGRIAVQITPRELSSVEAKLISPDRAANARGFSLLCGDSLAAAEGDWRAALVNRYQNLLSTLRSGAVKRVLLVGDSAIQANELDLELKSILFGQAVSGGQPGTKISVALTSRAQAGCRAEQEEASDFCLINLPARTVNEKSGLFVNRNGHIQKLNRLLTAPFGSLPEWQLLARVAALLGKPILSATVIDERGLFTEMAKQIKHPTLETAIRNLKLSDVSGSGVSGLASQV